MDITGAAEPGDHRKKTRFVNLHTIAGDASSILAGRARECGLARLGLRWDDVRGLRFVAGVVARLMSDEVSGGYKAALVGESGRICAADVAALDGRGRESRRRGGRAVERATVREAAGVGCEAAHRRTLSGTI